MRHYEVIAVIHPDQQGRIAAMIEVYKKIVADGGGVLHRLEDWGRRPLAYPIQNQHKAQYVLMNIECGDATLDKLRETFRFSDSIMRSMIVRRDEAIVAPSVMKQDKRREGADSSAAGGESKFAAKAESAEAASSSETSAGKDSAAEKDENSLFAKIKKRIIVVAQNRETITYEELRKAVEAERAIELFGPLDKISKESNADKGVLLSVVVVRDDAEMPGKPFFRKAAADWGKDVDSDDEESRRTFFAAELARAYDAYRASAADSGETKAAEKDAAAAAPSDSSQDKETN